MCTQCTTHHEYESNFTIYALSKKTVNNGGRVWDIGTTSFHDAAVHHLCIQFTGWLFSTYDNSVKSPLKLDHTRPCFDVNGTQVLQLVSPKLQLHGHRKGGGGDKREATPTDFM